MGASWEVSASVSQIYLPSSSGSPCPDVRVLYHNNYYFKLCSAIHLPLVEEGDFLLDIVKMKKLYIITSFIFYLSPYFSEIAATPGNTLPSKYSIEAPPPVEM